MRIRRFTLYATFAVLALIAAFSAPAFPQEGEAAEQPAAETEESSAAVQRILAEQENSLAGRPFSYQPGGRRDPFAALVTARDDDDKSGCRGGISCMGVNELDLTGIIKDATSGDMALVMGPDNKGYFLRAGDAVYDGTVLSVDARLGVVTFRQKIDDPRMIKPYRDVTKRLVPQNEESGE